MNQERWEVEGRMKRWIRTVDVTEKVVGDILSQRVMRANG
jgi:hypothetical protein